MLGNAGAVRVDVNGQPPEVPAEPGEVYDGSVVLREGQVLLVS